MDEMRTGEPGRNMQLDQAIARQPEGDDVSNARPRLVAEVARRCDADQPFLAAERAQALRDPPMPGDPGKAQTDMRQMHDPQPRLAIAQNQLCLADGSLRIIAGLHP